jgi:hypothetical protein
MWTAGGTISWIKQPSFIYQALPAGAHACCNGFLMI